MSGKKTNKHTYILVLEIETMKVGHHYNNALHCTVLPWFYLSVDFQTVIGLIKPIIDKTPSFTIKSDKSENFGGDQYLPAFTIVKDKNIFELHKKLADFVSKQNGSFLEPKYIGAGWRPHVTTQGDKEFKSGCEARINAVYLIEAIGDDLRKSEKMVRARLEFGL